MEARWSARRVTRQLGRSDCVVTSGSKRCHLCEDQAQDALDRPIVKKTTALKEMHACSQLLHQPPSGHSGAACEETGMQRNGTRSSLASDPDSTSTVMAIVFRVWRPRGERLNPAFALQRLPDPQIYLQSSMSGII
ncbi:uncharacterized protein TNCV_5129011 [Trichonephila clavipes]|nr:uncharacterized protein TNCV_5129011 [Trichonephila clavipes]